MQCPACRAENTERVCRRCKADLGLLWDVAARRAGHLQQAGAALASQDIDAAWQSAHAALRLSHGPDATRVLALTHLLTADYAQALHWWRETQKASASSEQGRV